MINPLPSFSIRVTLAKPSPDIGEVIARARNIKGGNAALKKAISLGLLKLVTVIQRQRFSGKGPFPVADHKLGVRSGRLRGDIRATTKGAEVETTSSGYRARIGSSVEYFAAHEIGFDGTVNVPAHRRKAYTTKRGYSVLEQSVRSHSKRMKVPRRAPLRTGIEDHSMRVIGSEINTALTLLFEKGGRA